MSGATDAAMDGGILDLLTTRLRGMNG